MIIYTLSCTSSRKNIISMFVETLYGPLSNKPEKSNRSGQLITEKKKKIRFTHRENLKIKNIYIS